VELRELMLALVTPGTGTAVAIARVPAAVTAGTAELAHGPTAASNPARALGLHVCGV